MTKRVDHASGGFAASAGAKVITGWSLLDMRVCRKQQWNLKP